ncbi:uncharacterized protein LOC110863381 [Folsomia candida]|uniref:Uncharacterized protein n=1 Tax=Folsomia candida TaxID=158441 RepID=A0A226F0L4_FOLCA|nr:uncharacterized protein LOC110863381 [Folsomia candida]OXA62476.1 hypothetical protein Fcan01_03031 [Folsomia candida]
MKRDCSLVILFGVGVVIFGGVVNVNGDDASDKTTCVLKSKQMLKSVMKSFSTCNKEMGMMNKTAQEYHDSLGCIIKCVMKKFEVLDKDDLITEAMVKDHVEKRIPQSQQKHAHEGLMKCVKLHDDLDPKDPKCKVYQKLGNCMQDALTDLCGVMPLI